MSEPLCLSLQSFPMFTDFASHVAEFSPVKVDLTALQIPEEKIVVGIHAHALSVLTISKIRKTFNKFDSKSVAKQVGFQRC